MFVGKRFQTFTWMLNVMVTQDSVPSFTHDKEPKTSKPIRHSLGAAELFLCHQKTQYVTGQVGADDIFKSPRTRTAPDLQKISAYCDIGYQHTYSERTEVMLTDW